MSSTGCSRSTPPGASRRSGLGRARPRRHRSSTCGRSSSCPGWSTCTRTCRRSRTPGLGSGLDLLTWLDRYIFPLERGVRPIRRRAAGAGGVPRVRRRRHDDGRRLRGAVGGLDRCGLRRRRGARHSGRHRQGDDGSAQLRHRDRAGRDPRDQPAPVGRARRRAGTAPMAGGCSTRSRLASRSAAPPTCCASPPPLAAHAWRVLADAPVARTRPRSPRSRGSFPRRATTSTSTTAPAPSARGRSWRTPSTCRRARSSGWSRADARVAHCPASNLFLSSGMMPLGAYRAAGMTVGLGSDVAAGPEVSIFSVMRAGAVDPARARADRPRGPGRCAAPARLAADGDARRRARAGARGRRSARWRRGRRPISSPSTRASRARCRATIRPSAAEDVASRLVFRPHPDMVRAAWVRGRLLAGPPGLDGIG